MLPPLKQASTTLGTIEYRESGRSDAPALVLLHGIGSNSAGFRCQYGPLGERFRVIAWNAPGYCGSSPLRSENPQAADYAAALADLLAALGIEQVHLVGSSWGTLVATAFAGRYPARVRSIVLSAPTSAFGTLPQAEREKRIAERIAPLKELGPAEMSRRGAERLVAPGTSAELLDEIRKFGEGLNAEGFTRAVRMLFAADGIAQLAALDQPVLILSGTEDRISPTDLHARKLAAAARNARLEMFPGAGHLLKLEAPERFNAMVLGFAGQY